MSLAFTTDEIRSRAILPGSGGAEHQTIGAIPQPANNTAGSRHLDQREEVLGCTSTGLKIVPSTELFNSHRAITLTDPVEGVMTILLRSTWADIRRIGRSWFGGWLTVNEFYKKGCQDKTSPSTGGMVRRLDLQPTVYVNASDRSGFCSERFVLPLVVCRRRQCQSSLRDFASEIGVVIKVLSEARGLSLFLIIRGGIACKWVTRCRSRRGLTH